MSPGFAGCHVPVDPGQRRRPRGLPLRPLSGGSVRCPPIDRGGPAAKTPSRLSDGRYQEERARPGVILHAPMSYSGETQCRALGSLEWWPFCRACPQRRCWPRQWSRSRATALSSIPTQTAKIKGQAIPMAIMSNPPPKGMIGRAVKPLAWHRSERAPTDPVLTAALTRRGTESGPPGIEARRPGIERCGYLLPSEPS